MHTYVYIVTHTDVEQYFVMFFFFPSFSQRFLFDVLPFFANEIYKLYVDDLFCLRPYVLKNEKKEQQQQFCNTYICTFKYQQHKKSNDVVMTYKN